MEERELAEVVEQQQYFEAAPAPSPEEDEGTRDMGPLYPFLISGGTNTERYYFTHINDTTEYKFNIKPKYFADESNYTEAFPKRINEILNANTNPKIFCVFDWDTIYGIDAKIKKHEDFEKQFRTEIDNGNVVICPSMPSIEYWFLLHFEDKTDLLKNYRAISNILAPYIKPCFADPTKNLKKLLKKEEFLQDSTWVKNLCSDGKLDAAIERAEDNINAAVAADDLKNQSYSYVYKAFKER
ncbi:MAG: RloB domain-containing protein [Prevotella sp.]|nr:RloB domain-containing protein [Prevotella sp.]MBQ6681223.1 RloB domain-containing protein [Prevotella sp.]